MDFSYTENQKMIADMIRQFGKQNITPFVREWLRIILRWGTRIGDTIFCDP